MVNIGDKPLTIADVVAVARRHVPVRVADRAVQRIRLSRRVVDCLVEKQARIYGVTTGYASLRNEFIGKDNAGRLSLSMIRSHSAGVGEPFDEDVVRAAMLLRAHTMAQGNSGARPELIQRFVAMLNARIYPFVPQQGSVGASGDLAPLSHLCLAVIGDPHGRAHRRLLEADPGRREGFVEHSRLVREDGADYVAGARVEDFVRLDGPAAAKLHGALLAAADGAEIGPPEYGLAAKEGLAAINGAVFSTATLALALHDAGNVVRTAELAAALSYEAVQAVPDGIDEGIVELRNHPGHAVSAGNLRKALDGSDLVPIRRTALGWESVPCGLNMAHYNRALLELGREQAWKERAHPGLRALRDELERGQAGIWDRISAERERAKPAPGTSGSTYPKERELEACRAALGPAPEHCRRLLGWSDAGRRPAPPLPAEDAARLASVHIAHLGRIVPEAPELQDNYSFRAAATVVGAARETLDQARRTAEIEINSSTDNPLILLDRILGRVPQTAGAGLPTEQEFAAWLETNWTAAADEVKSAANFHGEPVGHAADQVAAVLAEVGSIAERRVANLTDRNHSRGLPPYLAWQPGLNSGFMIPQCTAASLVSENRILANPATTDSIPTGELAEDHVAMSTLAARKCAAVVLNVERIVAIELLSAYQAVQFRKPCRLGAGTTRAEKLIAEELGPLFRELAGWKSADDMRRDFSRLGLGEAAVGQLAPCVLEDVVLYPLIEGVASLVRRGRFGAIIDSLA